MVGRVCPRHRHRGRPLNSVVKFHSDMEASVKKTPFAALLLAVVIMALAVSALDMSGGSVQVCDEGKSLAPVRGGAHTPERVASVALSHEYLVQGDL